MKGTHHIIVQNNVVRYEFDLHRNITIIRGESATGKTQLISMLESFQRDGESSGIDVYSDAQTVVLYSNNWETEIRRLPGCIFFIDEGQKFVATKEFALAVKEADAYFVIITRQNLDNLPYSVEEVYGIRSAGKYRGLKQTYNEFYRLYGSWMKDSLSVSRILTEDSNAGHTFFQECLDTGIDCESAEGKSNVYGILWNSREIPTLVIADGAAFANPITFPINLLRDQDIISLSCCRCSWGLRGILRKALCLS